MNSENTKRGNGSSIVVGVDGCASSKTAVRWAVQEASTHKLPLRIVHVTQWPVGPMCLHRSNSGHSWRRTARQCCGTHDTLPGK